MKTVSDTSWSQVARVAGLAVTLALTATAAQAGDVFWSVGVNSPGVAFGVSNAAPVYVAPAPVYVAPPPVAVYAPPPVVVPAPTYRVGWMAPAPAPVYPWGWGPRYREEHHHHHRGWDRDGEGRGRDWR